MRFALRGLEKVINTYLRLDPDTVARCAARKGTVIKITLTDWKVSFFILLQTQGLSLMPDHPAPPQAEIYGSSWGLFKTGWEKGTSAAAFENNIEMTGDTHLAQDLRDIFAHLDIDWEEHLSSLTGDILAHRIGSHIRSASAAAQYAARRLQKNITDYLQMEAALLPRIQDIQDFIADVTRLREDVDRAEARLKRLYSQSFTAL